MPVSRPTLERAGPEQHHDLLERRVAGALADAVDGALDLPRAGQQRRRTSWRPPGPGRRGSGPRRRRPSAPGPAGTARAKISRVLVRHRVADRVGDVDRGRALLDRDLHDLGHELDVGAAAVLGRELDVVAVLLGVRDGRAGLADDVLARGLQLALDVDVGGRDEGVDARALGVLDRVPGGVDVLRRACARGRRSPGPRPSLAIAVTASKSPGEVIGKPASMMSTPSRASWCAISSFSCVFSEMPGDCSPSRSVVSKILYSVCFCFWSSLLLLASSSFFSGVFLRLSGRHARFPPRGRRRRRRESRCAICVGA